MDGENSSEFKFDGDDQEAESFYHEEFKDLRIEKLSQRITLFSILLPCLTAVVIYFGYQNLSGRVSRSIDAGSIEVQKLAEELEMLAKTFNQKLITFSTTLSTQDKDFGTSVEGRLYAIKNNIDLLQNKFNSSSQDLKRDLKQSQDAIEKLKISKADNQRLAAAVENFNAAMIPLEKELQTLKAIGPNLKSISSDISTLESKLTQKLDQVTEKTALAGQQYEQLKASLDILSNKTNETDDLALEVFKIKKIFQSQLSEEVADLNQRLDSIEKKVYDFDKISRSQAQPLDKGTPKTLSPPSVDARDGGLGDNTPHTPSGTITEKDLIE